MRGIMKKVIIISDNQYIYDFLLSIKDEIKTLASFAFRYSSINESFKEKYSGCSDFLPIDVAKEMENLIKEYALIISWHCKQLFPKELVKQVRCVNIHPGFNPYNRGWFPQVFSIINKLPCGVTIHEMDEWLDHGPIIYQQIVDIEEYDTSYTAYCRILNTEIDLFRRHILTLINGNYQAFAPKETGNLNSKKDFNRLLEIDLEKRGTFGEFIDILRALTHDEYKNAYFMDKRNNKICISISITPPTPTSSP